MQQNVERICLQAMQGLSGVVQLWCRLYFSEMREEARLHDEKHTKALASRHMKRPKAYAVKQSPGVDYSTQMSDQDSVAGSTQPSKSSLQQHVKCVLQLDDSRLKNGLN